jgi:formylglycine-generating enzyme required for sulfatase activity
MNEKLKCNDGYFYTSPVGSFHPNAFGLHDTLGNAYQWTEDCYSPNYQGAPVDGSARTFGNCKQRTVRGASWSDGTIAKMRTAHRKAYGTEDRIIDVGFRLARNIVSHATSRLNDAADPGTVFGSSVY